MNGFHQAIALDGCETGSGDKASIAGEILMIVIMMKAMTARKSLNITIAI